MKFQGIGIFNILQLLYTRILQPESNKYHVSTKWKQQTDLLIYQPASLSISPGTKTHATRTPTMANEADRNALLHYRILNKKLFAV